MNSKHDLPPLNIAILLNSYHSPFIAEIRDSYVGSIRAVCPDAALSFFYPAERADDLPDDPAAFDLIVVGGGNADPRHKHPWILRVHQFIRDVVAANHHHARGPKLCGICWGHQTIALLFGAQVVDMEVPELGVTEAKMTPAGRRFFARQSGSGGGGGGGLLLQQHHRRAVGSPPRGFSELLVGNQAFLSHNESILTLQGHPEKDARCAKLRIGDATRWFGVDAHDRAALARFERAMEAPHDGAEIWRRVLEWAREKHPSQGIRL